MDNRQRVLDWVPRFDERSRQYSAVRELTTPLLRSRRWACDTVLDQGREGACVGFGWSAELAAKPKVYPTTNEFALNVYRRAKQIDEWEGEDYDGTSVLAGAKAIMEITNAEGVPLIGGYDWAFGVHDVLRVVSHRGPVVLGINWYENMYDPDENNYIHVGGPVVGGHCILLVGQTLAPLNPDLSLTIDNVDVAKSRVRLHNSWGAYWGNNGEGFLSLSDLYVLLEENQGEACLPRLRTV